MVSRGFRNDGSPSNVHSFSSKRGELINRAMGTSKPYRQFLNLVGYELDTASWAGRPGADVAAEILTAVTECIDKIDQPSARQVKLAAQATAILAIVAPQQPQS